MANLHSIILTCKQLFTRRSLRACPILWSRSLTPPTLPALLRARIWCTHTPNFGPPPAMGHCGVRVCYIFLATSSYRPSQRLDHFYLLYVCMYIVHHCNFPVEPTEAPCSERLSDQAVVTDTVPTVLPPRVFAVYCCRAQIRCIPLPWLVDFNRK